MAPITERQIKQLASYEGSPLPVTSMYLNVDGRRRPRVADVTPYLDALVRRARNGMMHDLDRDSRASVEGDLERMVMRVKEGFDRSHTRGVAMFSCSSADWWEVMELTVPVQDRIRVQPRPYVRELERVVDSHERFALFLVDRQRARLFLFHQGELVESSETFEELPRRDDVGGMDRDHLAGHQAAAAQHHLRRAAELTFGVFQHQGFDHLVLGCPEELVGQVERELHPWLAERIAARVSVAVGASYPEVFEVAMAAEADLEARRHEEAVARLRSVLDAGGLAVAGLEPTLDALVQRRVDTLLVSEGFEAPGWRCERCGWLAVLGRACKVCDAEMAACDDVVEEATEEAVTQSCRIMTCASADLDVVGRIGALLRF